MAELEVSDKLHTDADAQGNPSEPETTEESPKVEGSEENSKSDETETTKSLLDAQPKEEEIEYDIQPSEGSPLSESQVSDVLEFAKKNKLSNEAAQEVLSYQEKAIESFKETAIQSSIEANDQWYNDIVSDKELGGDNLSRTEFLYPRVLKEFGSEQLIEDLRASHMSNYKELVRMCVRIGEKFFTEDQPSNDTSIAEIKAERTKGDILYGS